MVNPDRSKFGEMYKTNSGAMWPQRFTIPVGKRGSPEIMDKKATMIQYVKTCIRNAKLMGCSTDRNGDLQLQQDQEKALLKAQGYMGGLAEFIWEKRVSIITPPRPKTQRKSDQAYASERFMMYDHNLNIAKDVRIRRATISMK